MKEGSSPEWSVCNGEGSRGRESEGRGFSRSTSRLPSHLGKVGAAQPHEHALSTVLLACGDPLGPDYASMCEGLALETQVPDIRASGLCPAWP